VRRWRDYTGTTRTTARMKNGPGVRAAKQLISLLYFGGLGRN
jgi:hypothetical protein